MKIRHIWSSDAAPLRQSVLGEHAKRLLADPVLALAFERIDRKLTEQWRHTAVGDDKGREAAYRLHWAVEQLKSELAAILGDAKVLEAEQKAKDRREEIERKRRER